MFLTGPGMGIAVQNAGGFRGFRLADSSITRGAGRVISTASDGINVSAFAGDLIVRGKKARFTSSLAAPLTPLSRVQRTASCSP